MFIIILILIGLFKNKKIIIYIALGVLYIISTPIFTNNFFKIIEGHEFQKPIKNIQSVDAIVVLSGMLEINEVNDSIYIEWIDPDRFFGGIALFKAGKANKLIFTGAVIPLYKKKLTEGELLKRFAISYGIPSEKIFVTKDVENTADEAIAVKELINPYNKIILVTSAYHMFRAEKIFQKQNFIVTPYKLDYRKAGFDKGIMNFMPSAENLKLTEIGIREIYGRTFYILKE